MDVDSTWFVLAKGMSIDEEEIEIIPSIKLKKIPQPITIFDLAAVGAKGFHQWSLLGTISELCTVEFVSNPVNTSGFDTLNRVWLLNVLLILRNKISLNAIVSSKYSWTEVAGVTKRDDLEKLKKFQGCLLDYHSTVIVLPDINEHRLNSNDVKWINRYYEIANQLAAKDKNFYFALTTLHTWRYTSNMKSSVALLWAAIESIIGASSEIVFRISLNVASILKPRGETRYRKFEEIKKLYNLRSKVVHGSMLKDEEMEMAVKQSFELLRDLVVYMIESGKIITNDDFKLAIFY